MEGRRQRPLNRIRSLIEREPINELTAKAAALRSQTLLLLHQGWKLGTIGVAANLLLTSLILLASLRFVGVTSAELSSPAGGGRPPGARLLLAGDPAPGSHHLEPLPRSELTNFQEHTRPAASMTVQELPRRDG